MRMKSYLLLSTVIIFTANPRLLLVNSGVLCRQTLWRVYQGAIMVAIHGCRHYTAWELRPRAMAAGLNSSRTPSHSSDYANAPSASLLSFRDFNFLFLFLPPSNLERPLASSGSAAAGLPHSDPRDQRRPGRLFN